MQTWSFWGISLCSYVAHPSEHAFILTWICNGSEFQHKTLALGFQIPCEEVFEPQKPIQKKRRYLED